MKKIYRQLLIALLLSACATETTETLFFDQVTYTEKSSFLTRKKYPYNPDETAREPRRTSVEMIVLKDSTTRFSYSFKERLKKSRKHGEFYLQKTNFDTSMVDNMANFTQTDFKIEGGFSPPKNAINPSVYSMKGIVFKRDGSCIQTYHLTQNETAYSSLNILLGEYKVLNDTVHIVYFLRKSYSRMVGSMNPWLKNIHDVSWKIAKPSTSSYLISSTRDTLRKISENASNECLIASDSVQVIPIHP